MSATAKYTVVRENIPPVLAAINAATRSTFSLPAG